MKTGILPAAILVVPLFSIAAVVVVAQPAVQRQRTAPIYRVSVVERTAKAINYQYRSGPTMIDFRGTVLLPRAKGEATVESKQGRTEIDAKLGGLADPQLFGTEYLTYVLWAITPEGGPHNIGELLPGSSDKARIHVTTDLQAFALIVTAEPYSAVRKPSDVVVAENQVRPDTEGIIKAVEAKYELLPRGQYAWRMPSDLSSVLASAPKVSTHEYDALTELYQAQNALGIARNAKAQSYAPDTLAQAEQLLGEARQLHDSKADYRRVVQIAREAAQTAEDARVIAQTRRQEEQLRAANAGLSTLHAELSASQRDAEQASQEKQRALDLAQQAQAQADAAQTRAQAAIAARNQAKAESQEARQVASRAISQAHETNARTVREQQQLAETQKREMRMNLLQDLKGALLTLDTGRGLVATVPDDAFQGGTINTAFLERVGRVATILMNHPDLHVSVEGYSDSSAGEILSGERADEVRRVLLRHGLATSSVSAAGLGDSRPLASRL
jgi:outer membrane protein OmpA-like peptidoglycan-associated protein